MSYWYTTQYRTANNLGTYFDTFTSSNVVGAVGSVSNSYAILKTSGGSYRYTQTDGIHTHDLGTNVALSNNHSGGAVTGSHSAHSAHDASVGAVDTSLVNANIPKYLGTTYIIRIK
jgi:hypothetical protein